jgi:FkbM family methyltransferase
MGPSRLITESSAPGGAPLDPELQRRVDIALRCHDTDEVPKVEGAGEISVDAGGTSYQMMHNGVRIVAGSYYGDWMTAIIRGLRGHHEPQEEKAFAEVVPVLAPGSTIVELGAFWAYYSLWFLHTVPGGRAFLIEPDPNNLEAGRRNFALNGRMGDFRQASIGRASAPPQPFECESDGMIRHVPVVSVDDFVDEKDIDRVELLLADVQGAELEMLRGARRTIERRRLRFVFVSTHHHQISGDPLTHERCLSALREHGAVVLVEHTVAESFSGDGLIVASFDPADRHLAGITVSRNRSVGNLFPPVERDLAESLRVNEGLRSELEEERRHLLAATEAHRAEGRELRARVSAVEAEASDLRAEIDAIRRCLTMRVRAKVLEIPGVRSAIHARRASMQHIRRALTRPTAPR